MSEIHIGSKKKLRKTIAMFEANGFKHNLKKDMKVPRHTGISVIVDNEKKEAVV